MCRELLLAAAAAVLDSLEASDCLRGSVCQAYKPTLARRGQQHALICPAVNC